MLVFCLLGCEKTLLSITRQVFLSISSGELTRSFRGCQITKGINEKRLSNTQFGKLLKRKTYQGNRRQESNTNHLDG